MFTNNMYNKTENTNINDIINKLESGKQNHKDKCKILSEIILKCRENEGNFYDCYNILEMFSDKCLHFEFKNEKK